MRYVLLIHSSNDGNQQMTEEQIAEMYRGHERFGNELGALGKMVDGAELHGAQTGKLVRHVNGEVVTSDGPFMETKEQLGGFYIINADSIDEAAKWAAKIPASPTTTIEVRPIVEH
jgi:hypothetical protein